MKPKLNRKSDKHKSSKFDQCQTPPYALDPLIPFLQPTCKVWEPAAGDGYLVRALRYHGFTVIASDVLTGQDYFTWSPDDYDVMVTNPPYSQKHLWLAHACELGKPQAQLVPVESIGAARMQKWYEQFGAEFIYFDARVDFNMPGAYSGWENSSAQFPVMWATVGLNIGRMAVYGKINKPSKTALYAWDHFM